MNRPTHGKHFRPAEMGARPSQADEAPSDVPRKMLVLDLGSGPLTLMVDEIGDVFELAGEGWRPPPETLGPRRDALFGIFPLKDQIILGLKTSAVYAEPGDP